MAERRVVALPNGDCAVGAANKSKIEALEREQNQQYQTIKEVCGKLDRLNWWLVCILGGVIVSLALQIAGRWS